MGILCSVCVWHSIIPLLDYEHELAQTADRCALVIMGSVYLLFHLCFFLYIYFVVSTLRAKTTQLCNHKTERVSSSQLRIFLKSHAKFQSCTVVGAKTEQLDHKVEIHCLAAGSEEKMDLQSEGQGTQGWHLFATAHSVTSLQLE